MYTKTEVLFASQRPAIVQLDGVFLEHICKLSSYSRLIYHYEMYILQAEVIFMSAVQCLGLLILITELVSCIFAMDFRMEREVISSLRKPTPEILIIYYFSYYRQQRRRFYLFNFICYICLLNFPHLIFVIIFQSFSALCPSWMDAHLAHSTRNYH